MRMRMKARTRSVLTTATAVAALVTGAAAFSQVQYHVADDFSVDGNPNGAWSYGYTNTLGGSFNLFTMMEDNLWGYDFLHAWQSGISWDDSPQIIKNTSDNVLDTGTIVYEPQQTILHPGINDQKAIARFTAPIDGLFQIDCAFEGRDDGWGTHTDVHVLINNVSVFDDEVDGFEDVAAYLDSFDLFAGDTVDFVVGFGGDFFNGDSTSIDATITCFDCEPPPTLVIDPDPLVAGETGSFIVTNANPNENTYLAYSTRGMGSTYVPFLDVTLDLRKPKQAGNKKLTDANGNVTWTLPIPPNVSGITLWLQAVQYQNKTNVVTTIVQ